MRSTFCLNCTIVWLWRCCICHDAVLKGCRFKTWNQLHLRSTNNNLRAASNAFSTKPAFTRRFSRWYQEDQEDEVERLRNARLARMINDSDQDLPGPARRAMKREGTYILLLLLLLLFTHAVQYINEMILYSSFQWRRRWYQRGSCATLEETSHGHKQQLFGGGGGGR